MKIIRSEKGTALILVILMVSIIVAVTIELNAVVAFRSIRGGELSGTG